MRLLLILAILLLAGCGKSPSSNAAEAARIEKEVARRVEAARLDSIVRTHRLHTIRVVGFIVLAGGAVSGLLWLRTRRFPETPSLPFRRNGNKPPLWDDHYPPGNGRVIDFPAGSENQRPGRPPDPPNPRNPP